MKKIVYLFLIFSLSVLCIRTNATSVSDSTIIADSTIVSQIIEKIVKSSDENLQLINIKLLDNFRYVRYIQPDNDSLRNKLLSLYTKNSSCGNVLSFLSLSQELKDSLIKSKYISMSAKARLGDSISNQFYINGYKSLINENPINPPLLKLTLASLLYINSPEIKELIINALESDTVYLVKNYITLDYYDEVKYTLPYFVLVAYSKFFSDYSLFNENKMMKYFYFDKIPKDEKKKDEFKAYIKQIEDFLIKKEDYKISIKTKFLIIGEPPYGYF